MVSFSPALCPEGVPHERLLPLGERPLHEYLSERAETHADKPAIVYHGQELTYAALDDAVDRFATYLSERGHGPGDSLILFMQNTPGYYVGLFAGFRLGMQVTPIAPGTKRAHLNHVLQDTEAVAAVAGTDVISLFEELREETALTDVIYTRYETFLPANPVPSVHEDIRAAIDGETAERADAVFLADILADVTPAPPSADLSLDDVCYVLYSSGTTGLPKGSMHTYRNGLLASGTVATMFGYESGMDPQLLFMPISHATGLVNLFPQPLFGTTAVLLSRYEPEAVMTAVETYETEMCISTQVVIEELLDHPSRESYDLTSMEYVSALGFSRSLNSELVERWQAVTDGGDITPFPYASVETHGPQTIPYGVEPAPKRLGPPAYDVEICIRDPDTHEPLPDGEVGEISLKSPTLMEGYLNAPEKTADAFHREYYLTGDLGEISEEGHLYLRGRLKHMIKSSGFSVPPQEVESVLETHPGIDRAAVIGRDHETRGEEVVAFVIREDPSLTGDALRDWSADQLAPYKSPRDVHFVDELPLTEIGKINRSELEAQFE